MPDPIRILVADDSELFADVMVEILAPDESLQIVGAAPNGRVAVELCDRIRPAVVIMDVLMPVMGGLEAIEEIMARCPTPILVLSADPSFLGFEALRRGALDVRPKPSGLHGSALEQGELRRLVRTLASVPVLPRPRRASLRAAATTEQRSPRAAIAGAPSEPTGTAMPGWPCRRRAVPLSIGTGAAPARATTESLLPGHKVAVVGIVASTGGPAALATIFASLPPAFPVAIAVVQHLAPGFVDKLSLWLARVSPLRVVTAYDGLVAEPGTAVLAADHQHLTLDGCARCHLSADAPMRGHRPSGDLLLESLARSFGCRALGVVLTGMGDDGARGLLALRLAGAATLVEDESSAIVYGMPRAALTLGAATEALPLPSLGAALWALTSAGMGAQ